MKNEEEYREALLAFVRGEFLRGTQRAMLTVDDPLVESGILDSLRIAVLLTYIRDQIGVHVPVERIESDTFRSVRAIAAMLAEVPSEAPA